MYKKNLGWIHAVIQAGRGKPGKGTLVLVHRSRRESYARCRDCSKNTTSKDTLQRPGAVAGKASTMRFLPAAITPVSWRDLFSGIRQAGRGLEHFEEAFAQYFDAQRTYSFKSLMRTTYACMLAVKHSAPGDEVVLSRYSCPSFAHGILAAGLTIKYCDTDPKTLSFDMDAFAKLDFSRVSAVVCANLFGLVYPMHEVVQTCRAKDVYLVEGVDYGIGTEYDGKRIGAFGDFSILNFQEGKALPIGGGAVVTKHPEMMERIFEEHERGTGASNALMMTAFKIVSNPHAYDIFMKTSRFMKTNLQKRFSMEDTIRNTTSEYDFAFEADDGLDSLSGFQGGLGTALLDKMETHLALRRANAHILEEGLRDIEELRLIQRDPAVGKIHYIRYPCLVPADRRDGLIEHLMAHRVEASRMYVDHGMNIDATVYPGALQVRDELVTLPCHPKVTRQEAARIVTLVSDFFSST